MTTNLTDVFNNQQVVEDESEFAILDRKGRELEIDNVETRHADLLERKRLQKLTSEIDLSLGSKEYVNKIRKNNKEYMEGLLNSKVFINNDFKHLVPYHPRTLTLIAANTGDGKSTCAANLAYHDLVQGKNVMVISNEEKANDFYNRVTSIIKLWNYQNHQDFTEEQKKTFDEYLGILSQHMTVIDNDHQGEPGQTTTIEGFATILNTLLKLVDKGTIYDTVIIDYYQNISLSTKNPKLLGWEVQERVAKMLDVFKNVYPAPIVILAQKKVSNSDNESDFKDLIQGRKIILDVSTCAIELKADRANYKTDWTIRKSRFSAGNGVTISTGYQFGRYVPYSQEFKEMVEKRKTEAMMDGTLKKDMKEKE